MKITNETYQCKCPIGFTGETCHEPRNCYSDNCHSDHSHCIDEQICACLPQHHLNQAYCDAVSDCSLGLCLNGGTCVKVQGSYYCECPPDYTGLICQEKVIFSLLTFFF
jgi:hypothetical protein